jgi:uncharacterized protein YqeY
MSLTDTINADIKTAMLAKDEVGLRALRAIKSALIIAKTSGASGESSADEEIKMLQKLVKQRKESADIYISQNRPDLAQKEQEEIAVIEKYLPKQMSEDEIRTVLKQIIESVGAKAPSDTGKVMGTASKQLAGKADNKIISTLVKEMLA